jgi:hypothetical protein
MKNGNTISARLPPEIINGIDQFQRKQNLAFRTDALIEIVKVACSAVGIDLSDIPADPALPTQATEKEEDKKEETEPPDWVCPLNGRMGDYARCMRKTKQDPEKCNITCKALTKYWRGIVFGAELTTEEAEQEEAPEKEEGEAKEEPVTPAPATQKEPEDKPEEKPITQKETATPPYRSLVIHETQTAPKPTPEKRPEPLRMGASEPQEPSVAEETPKDQPGMKAPETVGDPDPVVQQAAYIRTLREKSEKKPKTRGQQTFGPEKERQA